MFARLLLKTSGWMNQTGRANTVWFGQHCVWVAWLGLLLAVVVPPHGLGFSICWLQNTIGLPCPGCGLTRSLSCGIRGLFAESWNYHPFGLFILTLFLLTALRSLAPERFRDRLAGFIRRRAACFTLLYLLFVIAFVGFGAIRALRCHQTQTSAAHLDGRTRTLTVG